MSTIAANLLGCLFLAGVVAALIAILRYDRQTSRELDAETDWSRLPTEKRRSGCLPARAVRR